MSSVRETSTKLWGGVCPDGSDKDRREMSRYLRQFVPAMVAYAVALVVAILLVGDEPSGLRRLVILLPAIPIAWVAVVVLSSIRRADDYLRQLQLQAIAYGFAVAMVGLVVSGLLATVDLQYRATPWIVYGLAMSTWAIAGGYLRFRDS